MSFATPTAGAPEVVVFPPDNKPPFWDAERDNKEITMSSEKEQGEPFFSEAPTEVEKQEDVKSQRSWPWKWIIGILVIALCMLAVGIGIGYAVGNSQSQSQSQSQNSNSSRYG